MTNVIHIKNQKYTNDEIFIGRPSIFGNPIILNKTCPVCFETHKTNGTTLNCFKKYLELRIENDSDFKEEVKNLYGMTLVCYCKPKPCHGDILAETTNYLNLIGV